MSMTEILDELPRLDDGERQTILRRLVLLDAGLEIDETPEMLAAIDAGIASRDPAAAGRPGAPPPRRAQTGAPALSHLLPCR